jgi:DNA-binding transcriptional MerR regulator
MSTKEGRTHLTIGEVLNLLKDEFPDVTISKIRFLESQGLLQPERTPSGYRKFYQEDVERLKYILSQQKERFLPLKVIKKHLSSLDGVGEAYGAESGASPTETPLPRGEPIASSAEVRTYSKEALADAADLDVDRIAELERYGLIGGRVSAEGRYYTDEDLKICRIAKAMMRHGLEARHLRMYKVFVDKEAALFQQLVEPMMKQKNPEAQKIARSTLGELAALARELNHELLRRQLRQFAE